MCITYLFNVCTVPPSKPGNFRVEQSSVTSVFARIRWDLTNQTADAGADRLIILLTYSNMSLVQEIELPGNAEQVALNLIPGTNYFVRLRAENPDGMIVTDPVGIETLNGSKYYYVIKACFKVLSIYMYDIIVICKSEQ